MNGSQETKGFEDPLFSRVSKPKRKVTVSAAAPSRGVSWQLIVGLMVLVAILASLAYYLLQTQKRIEALNQNLAVSQNQLTSVSKELGESKNRLHSLQKGLNTSRSRLASQSREIKHYKSLYSELTQQQREQAQNLEAIALQKADQEQVEALKGETAKLHEQDEKLQKRLLKTDSSVSELRQVTAKNRSEIEGNKGLISKVGKRAEANATGVATLKKSLERDYYNFELHEKGSILKVFNVSLRLKDADEKHQDYNIEIYTGRRRIKKKNQNINEPILFFVEGAKKPYQLVVTKVAKKFVVGYLSIPKS